MSTSLRCLGSGSRVFLNACSRRGVWYMFRKGGRSEFIGIVQLPGTAWKKLCTDDVGNLVRRKGEERGVPAAGEALLRTVDSLGHLDLFPVALSAMRALGFFFPSQDGNMAYALMGLLRRRASMDHSDSEQQALARLCFSNDSDRIPERIVCMLPVREVESSSWLGTADAIGANLWDIESMC